MTAKKVVVPEARAMLTGDEMPSVWEMFKNILYGFMLMANRSTQALSSGAGIAENLGGAGEVKSASLKRVVTIKTKGEEAKELSKLKALYPDLEWDELTS